uniref:RNA silencing suppressor n=1 Tax=Daphne virus S TaxID=216614 RepID=Q70VI7_9VIRU|nr:hypothetical 12K protein [Daphne virus S]
MNAEQSAACAVLISVFEAHGVCVPIAICENICRRAFPFCPGSGRSSYARKRRAASIGRCHRCYRVWPPFYYTTKCDNKTCFPCISFNKKVQDYILWGVTEVIPHPGFNF